MGKIINDVKNDVVFTPDIVANLMCRLCEIDNNSIVIDNAAGSGALLKSAIKSKAKQIIGIEYNEYLFDTLVSNFDNGLFFNQDGLVDNKEIDYEKINVCLSNPPYSFKNKGLEFSHYIMQKMKSGKCCVLIQESAGNGQGKEIAKEILKNNTLLASIKMSNIFCGSANVQTIILLFNVGVPHKEENIVRFIDMTNDGFKRTSRKGSEPKDIDKAIERYNEVVELVLKGKDFLNLYNQDEYIEDKITLDGNDWTFNQHIKIDTIPTIDDFRNTVDKYMGWKAKMEFQKIFGDKDPYLVAMYLLKQGKE